jgi:hypothetical protein
VAICVALCVCVAGSSRSTRIHTLLFTRSAPSASRVDVATQEVPHAGRPSPPCVKKLDGGCQALAWDEGGRGLGVKEVLLSECPVPLRSYITGLCWYAPFDTTLDSTCSMLLRCALLSAERGLL